MNHMKICDQKKISNHESHSVKDPPLHNEINEFPVKNLALFVLLNKLATMNVFVRGANEKKEREKERKRDRDREERNTTDAWKSCEKGRSITSVGPSGSRNAATE